METIKGHDCWLDPPDEEQHHKDCPAHEDNRNGDGDVICLCQEIADAAFDDAMERRADDCREG